MKGVAAGLTMDAVAVIITLCVEEEGTPITLESERRLVLGVTGVDDMFLESQRVKWPFAHFALDLSGLAVCMVQQVFAECFPGTERLLAATADVLDRMSTHGSVKSS